MELPPVIVTGLMFLVWILDIVSLSTAWFVSNNPNVYEYFYLTESCLSYNDGLYNCGSYSSSNGSSANDLKAGGGVTIFLLVVNLLLLLAGMAMLLLRGFISEMGGKFPQTLTGKVDQFYKFVPAVVILPQILAIVFWCAIFPYSSLSSYETSPTIGAGIGVLIPSILICIGSFVWLYAFPNFPSGMNFLTTSPAPNSPAPNSNA